MRAAFPLRRCQPITHSIIVINKLRGYTYRRIATSPLLTEVTMARHVARMMDGDAFSAAVIKTDVVFGMIALAAAIGAHLV